MRARQMLPIVTLLQLAEVPSTMSAALKAEDIFNPADFQSMETFFTKIKNLTTNTEPESLQDVHIMEIGDRSLAFDIDKNCGAKGHSLNIILKLVCPTKPGVPAKSVVFEANTTIRATEQLDDGGYRYDIELLQFEEKNWQEFLSLFQSRQNEINEFIAAVKG